MSCCPERAKGPEIPLPNPVASPEPRHGRVFNALSEFRLSLGGALHGMTLGVIALFCEAVPRRCCDNIANVAFLTAMLRQ